MDKKIYIIVGVIITIILGGLLIFVVGNQFNENRAGEDANKAILDKVPDFNLEDWEGNKVALSDFSGKPFIINSWAVWCPFCVNELPEFAKLQEELGDKVTVIVVDRAEETSKQKKFTDELGVTDRLLFVNDPDDSFYKSIGGFSLPETLFVDKDGSIQVHKRGPMTIEEMREKVQTIL